MHLIQESVREQSLCTYTNSDQSILLGIADAWSFHAGSVKASYGHTEGAAGLHGALCSILSLQLNAAPPILHSRALNPYVSAALTDWAKSSHLQAVIPKVWFRIRSSSHACSAQQQTLLARCTIL